MLEASLLSSEAMLQQLQRALAPLAPPAQVPTPLVLVALLPCLAVPLKRVFSITILATFNMSTFQHVWKMYIHLFPPFSAPRHKIIIPASETADVSLICSDT